MDFRIKCNYMTTIPDKYHVMLVKYYLSSVCYILKPLHPDAITVLLDGYEQGGWSSVITNNVLYWDERICDVMIRDKTYLNHSEHKYSNKIRTPTSKHQELIRKFPDSISLIYNLSDDMKAYHAFIHDL